MNRTEARALFEYDEWANDRTFRSIEGLSLEQYEQPIESSFRSIRETIAHLVVSEWVWLRRWKGESPSEPPDWSVVHAIPMLRQKLRQIERERAEMLGAMSDRDLKRTIEYRNTKGEPFTSRFSDMFVHVVNHSSYHRGQIATMLRQVGAVPLGTDFIAWKREAAG